MENPPHDADFRSPFQIANTAVKVIEPGMQCSNGLPPDGSFSPLQLLPFQAIISSLLGALQRSAGDTPHSFPKMEVPAYTT